MPDQNSAANEHAIMQEITQPLTEVPRDPVAAVARVDFPLVLRGYDREAVDEYVRRTTQLVAELFATRSPEGAVRRAVERVGEQVSAILARAHDTADGITSQSRAEAEERLMRARVEAEELERDSRALADQLDRDTERKAREREQAAENRVHELDSEVDRIWVERDRIISDVRKLSEELSELAGAAVTRFPAATTDEAGVVPALGAQGPPAALESAAIPSSEPQLQPEAPLEFGADAEPEFAAGSESEFPSDPDAELHEIPADVHEDPLATVDHEPPTGEVVDEEPITDTDELVVESVTPEPVPSFDEHMISAEQPTSVLQRPRMRVIDLLHLSRERVIGCWQVDEVLIDPGPASCLEVLLAALVEPPRALLLTHIHLDHAGAAGSLVKRWPELEVYVHERGAAHLADPTRLLESARRLYGDEMDGLWGEVLPVPEANLRVLTGGERLFDGRFEVAYTPGHASHHVSYLYEQTAFVGDVAGVKIPPETLTIPATPPPDVDIEAWHGSIDQLLRWKPERLAMTHFGDNDDIGGQLADLAERLDMWAALVRTEDLASFVGIVEDEIANGASPASRVAYKQAAPPEQIYAGLERYWRKRTGFLETEDGPEGEEGAAEAPQGSAAEASTHAGRSTRASRWMPPTG